jgi:hypothetical protein
VGQHETGCRNHARARDYGDRRPPDGAAPGVREDVDAWAELRALKDGATSAAGPVTDIDETRKIPAFRLALALARVTANDD